MVDRSDRFWSKVDIRAPEECWRWLACTHKSNGVFALTRKKNVCAHREVWIRERGNIADGLKVLHTCETTTCCNPAHLYLDTDKGEGVKANRRKLTDESVAAIRAEYATGEISHRALAGKYGVAESTINRIISHKRWRS